MSVQLANEREHRVYTKLRSLRSARAIHEMHMNVVACNKQQFSASNFFLFRFCARSFLSTSCRSTKWLWIRSQYYSTFNTHNTYSAVFVVVAVNAIAAVAAVVIVLLCMPHFFFLFSSLAPHSYSIRPTWTSLSLSSLLLFKSNNHIFYSVLRARNKRERFT